jgi:serine protease AprX
MTSPVLEQRTVRSKAVWGDKRTLAAIALLVLVLGFTPSAFAERAHAQQGAKALPDRPNTIAQQHHGKLDDELTRRAGSGVQSSSTRVIVTLKPGAKLPGDFRKYAKRSLGIVNSFTLTLPNEELKHLADQDDVLDVHYDRPLRKDNYRNSITTGARAINRPVGFTGKGIGVAVIDSGIAQWHDDLTNHSGTLYAFGNQRVSAFVDFVNGQLAPYDDEGHGTHVAGIIAGNGTDSRGQKTGIAPDASLVVLKVLDSVGRGTVSNIIAALDWVLANHEQYKIRVVNLSVGAAVSESYWTDPLTLAAKRVVDAGIVVVSAAGNKGLNAAGAPQYGAIVAPGNAPWVLTVGASSTNGTIKRSDDTMAGFSSRGPTYLDWAAKPDLVAPGVGTVSLSDPWGTFYVSKALALADGAIPTPFKPYLSLSGTSMAAPVVAGTAALMLEANPSLTPNAVKAILQYTAEAKPAYDPLTEGAGFLNTLGAVRLAKFYATAHPGDVVPNQTMWSKHIIWGNHRLSRGVPTPAANAFAVGTTWGAARTADGNNIVWGTECVDATCSNIVWGTECVDATCSNIVWGTECADATCSNIVWGTDDPGNNIVWGTDCGGADCGNIVWGTVDALTNIVWGTVDAPLNIVWGTDGALDNIVWGTDQVGNIVWGTDCVTADCGNIVWGTDDVGNIVWGTDDVTPNIVWGTDGDGNIIWGTDDAPSNIVWGTDGDGNIVWGTNTGGTITWNGGAQSVELVKANHLLRLTDEQIFQMLNWSPPAPTSEPMNPPPTTAATSPAATTGTVSATSTDPTTATTDPSSSTTSPTTSTAPASTTPTTSAAPSTTTQPTVPPPATSSSSDPTSTTTSTTTPTTSPSTTTTSPTDPSTPSTSTGTTNTQPTSTTPSTSNTTAPPSTTTPTTTPDTTTAPATTDTTTTATTAPATVDATGTPVPGGSF